ncbi:MAG: PilZ domain-containing protein [Alphaproteobacteria bacterium]|nr:MAG: PilZ domain-containing protein [Alphaproteobacteria bacterium]
MSKDANNQPAKNHGMVLLERVVQRLKLARLAATEGRVNDVGKLVEIVREVVRDSRFPIEKRTEVLNLAKALELDSYKRATDLALNDGFESAQKGDMETRYKHIQKARELMVRALGLGAGDDFKQICDKKIEVIMMSGDSKIDVNRKKAKLSTEEILANEKKYSDRRAHPRFTDTVLQVTVNGQTYDTIDWSYGGMMLANHPGPVAGGQIWPCQIRSAGMKRVIETPVEVVRWHEDKTALSLRFVKLPPADLGELLGVVRAKAITEAKAAKASG